MRGQQLRLGADWASRGDCVSKAEFMNARQLWLWCRATNLCPFEDKSEECWEWTMDGSAKLLRIVHECKMQDLLRCMMPRCDKCAHAKARPSLPVRMAPTSAIRSAPTAPQGPCVATAPRVPLRWL